MEDTAGKPQERNKAKSKQKFLDAVGEILTTKGYTALKVNDIAATAGLDKKLIYKYFGGTEELMDAYVRSLDFWSNVTKEDTPAEITDGGAEFSKQMLTQQFDYVDKNKALQKILLWGLAEKRTELTRIGEEREASGEALFTSITDPYFGKDAASYRAIMAILISGIYYLNMYKGVNGETFCGIDLTNEEGKDEIKNALEKVIGLVYTAHDLDKQQA